MTVNLKYKTELTYLLSVVVVFFILRIVDFNGLYGQDSYEYFRYAREWKEFYLTFKIPAPNPWPIGFSAIGGLLLFVNDSPETLQLFNLCLWALASYYTYKIILLINPSQQMNWIFIAANIFLSPYCLRLSVTIMSDTLCLTLLVLGAYFYFRNKNAQRDSDNYSKNYLCSVTFFALSLSCRYTAVVIAAPFVVSIAYNSFKNKDFKFILTAILIGLICLSPEIYIKQNIQSFYNHNWLSEWNPINFFKRTFITNDGTYSNKHPNIFYVFFPFFHYGFGVIYLPFLFKKSAQFVSALFRNKVSLVVLISVIIYMLFIAGIPFQNNRFLCLIFPFAMILIYSNSFFHTGKYFAMAGIVFQSVLCVMAFKPFLMYNKTERTVCAELNNYKQNTIYTFSIDQAMKIYNPDIAVVNIWVEKLNGIKPNSLLLYNEESFSKEFADKNPEINYKFIKANFKLMKIKSLPEGWNLYAIK